MQRNLIWIIVFFLFLFEGTAVHWITPDWGARIAPQLVLVAIVYIALFQNRHAALLYGIIFGLLQGVVFYGHMIGAYSFALGLTGYLSSLVFRRMHLHISSVLVIVAFSSLLYQLFIFGLYRLFSIVNDSLGSIFMQHMLPTIMLNVLFALVIYIPTRNFFEQLNGRRKEEEKE
jgi:rod shape-determining protein MreD